MKCPNCVGDGRVIEEVVLETFQYGSKRSGPPPVMLRASFPKMHCLDCKFDWTDWRAEDSKQCVIDAYILGGKNRAA